MDLSIVMPCYNEAAVLPVSIPPLLKALQEAKVDYEVILVDNGSHDKTAEVIDSLDVRRTNVMVNQGYGLGVITGVSKAHGTYIAYMGADGQIGPQDFLKVWEVAKQTPRHTIVKGQRIARAEGFSRSFPSLVYNWLFALLFYRASSDINGTPKFMHTEDFLGLNMVSKNSLLDPELLIKAKVCDYTIIEVPVSFIPRSGGTSTVRVFSKGIEFIKGMIKWRLKI